MIQNEQSKEKSSSNLSAYYFIQSKRLGFDIICQYKKILPFQSELKDKVVQLIYGLHAKANHNSIEYWGLEEDTTLLDFFKQQEMMKNIIKMQIITFLMTTLNQNQISFLLANDKFFYNNYFLYMFFFLRC